MNLLTFDIEEWYLDHQNNGPTKKHAEYDRYLVAILNKLDERKLKATFLCVGWEGYIPKSSERYSNAATKSVVTPTSIPGSTR